MQKEKGMKRNDVYLLRKYHKILIVIALTTIFTGSASETILETMRQSGDIPDYMLLKVVNEHKEEIKEWAASIDPVKVREALRKMDQLLGTSRE